MSKYNELFKRYVDEILETQGHEPAPIVEFSKIIERVKELAAADNKEIKKKSIQPFAYCYNRVHKNPSEIKSSDGPFYFVYKGNSKYEVVGDKSNYKGYIFYQPNDKDIEERIVGLCIDGKKHLFNTFPGLENISIDLSTTNNVLTSDIDQEGRIYYAVKKTIERNPEARRKCIQKNGTSCSICGFDFDKTYMLGKLDSERLIHVHHLNMISKSEGEHMVSPEDLVPVCPNCHMVIHSRKDPFTPDEVRNMIPVEFKKNKKRLRLINHKNNVTKG